MGGKTTREKKKKKEKRKKKNSFLSTNLIINFYSTSTTLAKCVDLNRSQRCALRRSVNTSKYHHPFISSDSTMAAMRVMSAGRLRGQIPVDARQSDTSLTSPIT